jgi:hypothetical protein
MFVLSAILLVFIISCHACSDSVGSFRNEKGNFTLSWCFEADSSDSTNPDIVQFTMSMSGSAYVAIGFGGSMYDADMVIGWVDPVNGPIALDYYSSEETDPELDTSLGGSNDVKVISGSLINGQTTITFQRKLVTNDKFDKAILKQGANDMIYAWSSYETSIDLDMNSFIVDSLSQYNKSSPVVYHDDSHNHIAVDLSKADGIPDTIFGYEESGMLSRDLISVSYYGTLSTIQTQAAGSSAVYDYPFGTVVDFADEVPSTGRPLILLSDLERSVINMKENSKLSLSVWTLPNSTFLFLHPEYSDVMTKPRTTLLGKLEAVPESELENAKQTYLTKHPLSKSWINFSDFVMYRVVVEDVYVVGGFGNAHYIGWVGASQYLALDVQSHNKS